METNIKIIVATHKKYHMPNDEIYLPIHVGAEGKVEDLGYQKDNTGDNISSLNAGFCELTGLYWGWKNLDIDYIGLVHYRRHFAVKKNHDIWKEVLTYSDLQPLLNNTKIFLPKKRRYFIETLESHYAHTHYIEHLDETRKVIAEKYPDYLNSYDKVLKQRSGYMFNMMIMQKELLDKYCSWLFEILFELKERINVSGLSAFQSRFYGRISEIIFNVWLDYNKNVGIISNSEIKELRCIHMEKINWRKKGIAFLKAKFLNIRYEGSF